MSSHSKNFVMYGSRVSDETKAALQQSCNYEEILVSFGPFDSGALHCELFPILKEEREKMSEGALKARFDEKKTQLAGSHVVIVESTGEQPGVSESLEHVRAAVSTAKRYGAAEVTLVMPNTAYERQDRGFEEQGRLCSVNSEWLAQELKMRGCDRVITITPHSKGTISHWQKAFGEHHYIPLLTTELFAEDIKSRFPDPANVVIGAPDGADKPNDQGQHRARELAAALQGVSLDEADSHLFKIGKEHTHDNETKVTSFEGDVEGKDCVIIDDMIDGGSTMINAAKVLKSNGARSVTAYATHAICNGTKGAALERLLGDHSEIDHLVLTDTIPEIHEKKAALSPDQQDRINIVSVGPMLAQAIKDVEQQRGTHVGRFTGPMINGRVAGHN